MVHALYIIKAVILIHIIYIIVQMDIIVKQLLDHNQALILNTVIACKTILLFFKFIFKFNISFPKISRR